MFKNVLAIMIAGALATSVNAAEMPNTFSAGDTISSSEMNANFTYLLEKISTLEAKVSTLQAKAGIGETYAEMLLDGTYSGHFVQFGIDGEEDDFVDSNTNTITHYDITNANGFKEHDAISLTFSDGGVVTDSNATGTSVSFDLLEVTDKVYSDSWNEDNIISFWSVDEDKGEVTFDFPSDDSQSITLKISNDGSMLHGMVLEDSTRSSGRRVLKHRMIIMTKDK